MNFDSFLHIIHSASDFNIIVFHTAFYVFVGLLVYNLLRIIFYDRKLWEDSYFGVTIVGTVLSLNAVLLTFTLIQSIKTSEEISGYVSRELQSLYILETEMLPLTSGSLGQVKPFLKDYMVSVIENEWPLMDSGQRDEVTESKFHDLLIAARTFSIRNKSEENARQRIAESIPNVVRYRYDRIKTRGKGISQTYFFVIYFLEILLVIQYFLLTRRSALSQTILSIHLMILGVMLALIVVYNHPYEGETSNSSKEFLPMLERLDSMQGSEFK
jgi:hypothetical protein